ncbi:DUF4345 family protein [Nocardioides donggukensis]|uniref:DUF4345 family protein n=1 Tax=Nocardioides donggukensis TaxID=2774019 RepID=A0A927K953_9ACTN|nr:DUF4345 family protein [Nocardioides donggukensis]MBD8869920.1 DUF4345 family protein [Nocardioides donggukensis]
MSSLIDKAAATYAVIGAVAIVRPELVPVLFGGSADTVDARTEIRSVYGGLPLAIAASLVAAPSRTALPMGVLSAGMAAGRLASVAIEAEPPGAVTKLFLGVETALAVALFAGAAGLRRRCSD